MKKIGDSRFFEMMLKRYPRSPSIALCRIPELELFSDIELEGPSLDHCCGDGLIASLAFPNSPFDAGVDIDKSRLAAAKQRGFHKQVEWGDAADHLPFADDKFATVINNSGIEHIRDLDGALAEISRVTRSGGRLIMNVLNNRYFENWPGSEAEAERYRAWQPFYHALSADEWREKLELHGFKDVTFREYFVPEVSRILADLDFRYSGIFLRKHLSLYTLLELILPVSFLRHRWRKRFSDLCWDANPGSGCGFQVSAIRSE